MPMKMAWDFDNRESLTTISAVPAAAAALYSPSSRVSGARGPEVGNARGRGVEDSSNALGARWGGEGLEVEASAAPTAGRVGVERVMGDGERCVGGPSAEPDVSAPTPHGTRGGTAAVPGTSEEELQRGLSRQLEGEEDSSPAAPVAAVSAARVATEGNSSPIEYGPLPSSRNAFDSRNGAEGAGGRSSPIECGASSSCGTEHGTSRSRAEAFELLRSDAAADTTTSTAVHGDGNGERGTTGAKGEVGGRASDEHLNADQRISAAVVTAEARVQGRREDGASKGEKGVEDDQHYAAVVAPSEPIEQDRRTEGRAGEGEGDVNIDETVSAAASPAGETSVQGGRENVARKGRMDVHAFQNIAAATAPAEETFTQDGKKDNKKGINGQKNAYTTVKNTAAAVSPAEAFVQDRRGEDGAGKGWKGVSPDENHATISPAESPVQHHKEDETAAVVAAPRGKSGTISPTPLLIGEARQGESSGMMSSPLPLLAGEKGLLDHYDGLAPPSGHSEGGNKGGSSVRTPEKMPQGRPFPSPSSGRGSEGSPHNEKSARVSGDVQPKNQEETRLQEARENHALVVGGGANGSEGASDDPSGGVEGKLPFGGQGVSDNDDLLSGGFGGRLLNRAQSPGFDHGGGKSGGGGSGDIDRGFDDDSGKGGGGGTPSCSSGEGQERRGGSGSERGHDSNRGEPGGEEHGNSASPWDSVSRGDGSGGGVGGERCRREEQDAAGAATADAAEIAQESRSVNDSDNNNNSSFDGVGKQDENGDDDGDHGREYNDPAKAAEARVSAPPAAPAPLADDDSDNSDIPSEISGGGGSGDNGSTDGGGARLANESVREEQSLGDGDEYGSDFASQVGELQLCFDC